MSAFRISSPDGARPHGGTTRPVSRHGSAPALVNSRNVLDRAQTNAGNRAVVQALQRDVGAPTATGNGPNPVAAAPPRQNYVFLMGDPTRDSFYSAAAVYFGQHEKGAQLVRGKRTLDEVIAHVNAGTAAASRIIIVSHANEEGNLGFSLNTADAAKDASSGDRKPRLEFKELRDANASGALPVADATKIDSATRVEIRGCNIGRSQRMLDAIDQAFGGEVSVSAPTHKQEYSFHSVGKGKPVVSEEALFQYSISDPGHPTVTADERARRFRARYPDVPEGRWAALLKAAKEKNTRRKVFTWTGPNPPADDAAAVFARIGTASMFPKKAGWVVTYNGRTTVGDSWHFEVQADRVTAAGSETRTQAIVTRIPPDPDVLKAQQIADSGQPDAHEWTVVDAVVGPTLTRTVYAEHTEWVIDQKIIGKSGVAQPPTSDRTFYGESSFTPSPPPKP
ncbi:hypothetical protein VZC37_01475 [Gordonia sp. LSe1-13]|uniref:Uncharacterized protein n=1 Tax=Gordonia sesuvii TaxID=3116777 RepID=A0ABU7M796_9ACTN|nr:hypothetical protein [Gordonia sp. LSe1-13]